MSMVRRVLISSLRTRTQSIAASQRELHHEAFSSPHHKGPLLSSSREDCTPCRNHTFRSVLHRHPALMHTITDPDTCQRLMVIQPEHKSGPVNKPYVPAQCRLEEAVALVCAIEGWEVGHQRVEGVRHINNQTFFGKGKAAELKTAVRQLGAEITGVFVNTPILTPAQHRMLELLFRRDVFDRFGIVLRIFRERAQTREAKLQVELAEIPYTMMRLSEDSGGGGGVQAEGEVSTESRKSALKRRQRQLKAELGEIRSKRTTLREQRAKRSATPTVAVVGYTNAGKTTLIKALSHDVTMAPKDMLFATLDSTLHAGKLPCGLAVLYVDTIGFVSDLPVELVESFATTLQDSISADVLLHVIDGSHPQAYAQRANVVKVLNQLALRKEMMDGTINVINKIDRVLPEGGERQGEALDALVSAIDGTGVDELEMRIQEAVLRASKQTLWKVDIPVAGPHLGWMYSSEVTVTHVSEGKAGRLVALAVFSEQTLGKFLAKFSGDHVTLTPCHDYNISMRNSTTTPL